MSQFRTVVGIHSFEFVFFAESHMLDLCPQEISIALINKILILATSLKISDLMFFLRFYIYVESSMSLPSGKLVDDSPPV